MHEYVIAMNFATPQTNVEYRLSDAVAEWLGRSTLTRDGYPAVFRVGEDGGGDEEECRPTSVTPLPVQMSNTSID